MLRTWTRIVLFVLLSANTKRLEICLETFRSNCLTSVVNNSKVVSSEPCSVCVDTCCSKIMNFIATARWFPWLKEGALWWMSQPHGAPSPPAPVPSSLACSKFQLTNYVLSFAHCYHEALRRHHHIPCWVCCRICSSHTICCCACIIKPANNYCHFR